LTVDPAFQIPPLDDEGVPTNGDDRGNAEALSLGRGLPARDLKREVDESEHDRNERFKGHFDRIGIGFLYVAALAMLGAAGVWFWHIVTPCAFLDDPQLKQLQNLLTGGVLVSAGTTYLKKRLG
jgi:hypothetical protein